MRTPRSPASTSTPTEIATAARKVDIGIVGDCRSVLNQMLAGMKGKVDPDRYKDWRKMLADGVEAKLKAPGANKYVEDGDIHPLRLCEEIKQLHASATPSWWSTGRRSSTSAGNRCRPSRPATA